MNKKNIIFALAAFAVIASLNGSQVFSQQVVLRLAGSRVIEKSELTNLPNFIKINPEQQVRNEDFVNWAVYSLNLPTTSTFKAYSVEKDELGYVHTRYQQYVNNIPVEGSMIITHSMGDLITKVDGDYYEAFSPELSASLSEQNAFQSALKKVHAVKYMWENTVFENQQKQILNDPDFTFKPKGELVIVHKKDADYSAANMRLAYKFDIYAEEPLYRANVFVDANTGEILDEQNLICHADVVGTAVTKYSGTVPMTCDNTSGPYRLRETGRGNGINTYNLKTSKTYTNTDFTNASTNWSLTGTDQAAADAHWGAEMTYDYFKNIHNRNSIDDKGYALNSYVHYSTNYVNAFWDGTRMTYGDGSTSQGYNIMTALDVCGHEITHGLTSNTSKLGSGEAGALNEGNSDIFGTTIEFYARPSQHDWLMGADLMTNHKGLRDMSNPKNLGQPNCYKGTNWSSSGEVHANDGPFIYWYYLLCQGGSGTNDLGNAWSVTGITMDEAKLIAFRQNTVYFTSSTTYASARTFSIEAATDLFGACSPEVIATTNAWYAVGVGAQYSGSTLAVTSSASPATICAGSSAMLTATGGAATYAWSPISATTSTVTVSPTASTTYTVIGTSGACSAKSMVTITVTTPPTTPTITQNGAVLTSSSATGNQWYLNGVLIAGATAQTYAPTQSGDYTVIVIQGCPSASSLAFNYSATGIADNVSVEDINLFPNPSNGNFNLNIANAENGDFSVEITNSLGQLISRENINVSRTDYQRQYDLSGFCPGVYFIKVFNPHMQTVKKIIIAE